MDNHLARERFVTVIDAAIERSEGVPMRWGRNDCALWTGSIVRRVLGYDPVKDWRGKYWSQSKALKLVGKGGIARTMSRVARNHKWSVIEPRDAQPGDVGLCKTAEGLLACVINRAPGWWVGRVDKGYAVLRDDLIVKAWKVI